MTQVGNSVGTNVGSQDDLDLQRHDRNTKSTVLRYATSEDTKPNVLRNATAKQDYLQDLLKKVTSAYSETDLQGMLLKCDFKILTWGDNGNPDIVEVPIEVLGHSTEVRELNWTHVQDIVMSDERTWPPLEVCLWPNWKEKLDEAILLRIISGNHRTSAAKEKGLSSLPVRIFKVEREIDFRILAIRSNASHGLNFTEDENKKQAAYLSQEGKKNVEIAKILSKSPSVISRWLSGADSNASRKIEKIVQPQPVEGPTPKTLARTVPTVAQKIEALLIGENVSVNVQEAKKHIGTISAQKQQRLHTLLAWLQEALEG